MVHAIKLLPCVDVHVREVVSGTPVSVPSGAGRSFSSSFINRIGWLSIVPGPASGVSEKDLRRRENGQKREDSYYQ